MTAEDLKLVVGVVLLLVILGFLLDMGLAQKSSTTSKPGRLS